MWQSFYASFTYNTDGSNALFTLSLSQNALPLATLNGYDAVHRQVSTATLAEVITTSSVIGGFVLLTCIYMFKTTRQKTNKILPQPKNIIEVTPENTAPPTYDFESKTLLD